MPGKKNYPNFHISKLIAAYWCRRPKLCLLTVVWLTMIVCRVCTIGGYSASCERLGKLWGGSCMYSETTILLSFELNSATCLLLKKKTKPTKTTSSWKKTHECEQSNAAVQVNSLGGRGKKRELQDTPCLRSSKIYSNFNAKYSTRYSCGCAPTILASVKQFLRGLGSLTFLTLKFHIEPTSPWKKLGCTNVVKHEGYAIDTDYFQNFTKFYQRMAQMSGLLQGLGFLTPCYWVCVRSGIAMCQGSGTFSASHRTNLGVCWGYEITYVLEPGTRIYLEQWI